MWPLIVSVEVVGLGALVTALAALEAPEDREPQSFVLVDVLITIDLRFGAVTDGMLRGGATVEYLLWMSAKSWSGGRVDGYSCYRSRDRAGSNRVEPPPSPTHRSVQTGSLVQGACSEMKLGFYFIFNTNRHKLMQS